MPYIKSEAEGAFEMVNIWVVGWHSMGAWQAHRLAMDASNKGRINSDRLRRDRAPGGEHQPRHFGQLEQYCREFIRIYSPA